MSADLLIALSALFVAVALGTGALVRATLAANAPARRRLEAAGSGGSGDLELDTPALAESLGPMAKKIATVVHKSPKDMTRLRRRLVTAGYRSLNAAVLFSAAKIVTAIALSMVLVALTGRRGILLALPFQVGSHCSGIQMAPGQEPGQG